MNHLNKLTTLAAVASIFIGAYICNGTHALGAVMVIVGFISLFSTVCVEYDEDDEVE